MPPATEHPTNRDSTCDVPVRVPSMAHADAQIVRDPDIAQIEEAMHVASEDQAVRHIVRDELGVQS